MKKLALKIAEWWGAREFKHLARDVKDKADGKTKEGKVYVRICDYADKLNELSFPKWIAYVADGERIPMAKVTAKEFLVRLIQRLPEYISNPILKCLNAFLKPFDTE